MKFSLAGVFGPDRGSTAFPPGATSPSSYCASGPARPEEPTLRSQARSPRLSARNLRKDEKLLLSGTSLKLTVRKAGDNPSRHNLFKAMFRAAFRSASSRPSDYRKELYSGSASYCRSCLIDDRSPSVEIRGSANHVDRSQAACQKSEAVTEAPISTCSIQTRSRPGRCGCAHFLANRSLARIW
jgi:hypothetical protein